jgi:putative CocE/NonD family hydrolase
MRRLLPLLAVVAACSKRADRAPAPTAAPAPVEISVRAERGPAGAESKDSPDPRAAHIRATYTKYEYRIPMRDGVRLFTSVFVPNDAGDKKRYPFLMTRTPYSIAPYGADRYPSWLGLESLEKSGYIFVKQDVRGRHMSEGAFVDVTPHGQPINESTDTHDTIAWLVKNVRHHNGKVGMWGVSYPGFYTSAGAIDSHPALVAISPQAPVSDWWHGDDWHRNGAFNLHTAFIFYSRFGKPRPAPTDDEDTWKPFPFGTPDAYQYFLDLGPLSAVEATEFGADIAFWKDLAAHPDYDDFWKARNILPHLKNIRAATLVVGGWYDTEDLYGTLGTYRAIEQQNRGTRNTLLIGAWPHGAWNHAPGDRLGDDELGFATAEPYRAQLTAFFEHHLKGGPDPRLAEAIVFETGADRWRTFDAWPPKEVRATAYYLREGGALATDAPTGDGKDDYVSDPARPVPYTLRPSTWTWAKDYMAEDQRFVSTRPDVLVYQSAPLERDLTVAGPIEVELFVSTTGADADFVVKLVDANPGKMPGWRDEDTEAGKLDRGAQQTLVRGEPFRGRYRDDPSAPRPFTPGEVATLRFTLDDVFHTFQRGHRIMIQVQSSWFPFIDRNPQTWVPNIFEARPADFVKQTHTIHRAAGAASRVTLPVLPAADE